MNSRRTLFTISSLIVMLILVAINIHESNQLVLDLEIPKALDTLLLVPGHASLVKLEDFKNPSSWYLEPHQYNQLDEFLQHIYIASQTYNNQHLLIFSGGHTRPVMLSEADSYSIVAREMYNLTGYTEEFARDSFENCLFSVCRFKQIQGNYPRKIIVIGWKFKQERIKQHFKSIGFDEITYLNTQRQVEESILESEEAVKAAFLKDPFGCKGDLWEKKLKRNPFNNEHGYEKSCPELASVWNACKNGNNQTETTGT